MIYTDYLWYPPHVWLQRGCGLNMPLACLAAWLALTFFILGKHILQLWLVGGVCAARAENDLEIHCLNFGLPQRGLSPETETQPVGSVLGVGGLKTCLSVIYWVCAVYCWIHSHLWFTAPPPPPSSQFSKPGLCGVWWVALITQCPIWVTAETQHPAVLRGTWCCYLIPATPIFTKKFSQ